MCFAAAVIVVVVGVIADIDANLALGGDQGFRRGRRHPSLQHEPHLELPLHHGGPPHTREHALRLGGRCAEIVESNQGTARCTHACVLVCLCGLLTE